MSTQPPFLLKGNSYLPRFIHCLSNSYSRCQVAHSHKETSFSFHLDGNPTEQQSAQQLKSPNRQENLLISYGARSLTIVYRQGQQSHYIWSRLDLQPTSGEASVSLRRHSSIWPDSPLACPVFFRIQIIHSYHERSYSIALSGLSA
jgi:hypothetical protein